MWRFSSLGRPPTPMPLLSKLVLGTAVCVGGVYLYEPRLFISTTRTFRSLAHMAYIACDMKYTWWQQKRRGLSDAEMKAEDADLHQRSADRILGFIRTHQVGSMSFTGVPRLDHNLLIQCVYFVSLTSVQKSIRVCISKSGKRFRLLIMCCHLNMWTR